jgi:hypothetical protein
MEVFGLPRPLPQHDRTARGLRRHGTKLLAWTLGKDDDIGTRRRQQLRFPGHGRAIAREDRTLALEREKDRQARERFHARRALQAAGIARDPRHQYTSC